MIDNIELLNCRRLDCYPKQNYVKPKYRWPLSREVILANKRLFYSNVYNFILNADEIMSDSRYFLASVGFYTSIGRTVMPCLGTFVEWWKYRYQYSWDANDLPIWAISGNPMTGSSGCGAVDLEGNLHLAKLRNRFIEIVKSFNRISNRYLQAQEECESYPLDYVLTRLSIKI